MQRRQSKSKAFTDEGAVSHTYMELKKKVQKHDIELRSISILTRIFVAFEIVLAFLIFCLRLRIPLNH